MGKKVLERYWNQPSNLHEHKVISDVYDEIKTDIRNGCVFPALRKNEIHLYHEGGRILRIKPESAKTHHRYLNRERDGEKSICKLTSDKYNAIKKGCRAHNRRCLSSGGYKELWIVSLLFKRFSIWSVEADSDQPKLIDIEVRLRLNQNGSSRMIDLLFLDDSKRLTFIEVKRQHDPRVRGSQGEPEVVCQLRKYEELLKKKNEILCAYRTVGTVLGTAFGLTGFDTPGQVLQRVPLLICRENNKEGRDIWLNPRLSVCAKGEICDDHLIVDGGAIKSGVYKKPPPWCRDGLWKNLNLNMVFERIHNRENNP